MNRKKLKIRVVSDTEIKTSFFDTDGVYHEIIENSEIIAPWKLKALRKKNSYGFLEPDDSILQIKFQFKQFEYMSIPYVCKVLEDGSLKSVSNYISSIKYLKKYSAFETSCLEIINNAYEVCAMFFVNNNLEYKVKIYIFDNEIVANLIDVKSLNPIIEEVNLSLIREISFDRIKVKRHVLI